MSNSAGPSRRTSLAQPWYHKGGSALVLQVLQTEAFSNDLSSINLVYATMNVG